MHDPLTVLKRAHTNTHTSSLNDVDPAGIVVNFGLPEILLFNCFSSSLPEAEFYSNVSSRYSKKDKCIMY